MSGTRTIPCSRFVFYDRASHPLTNVKETPKFYEYVMRHITPRFYSVYETGDASPRHFELAKIVAYLRRHKTHIIVAGDEKQPRTHKVLTGPVAAVCDVVNSLICQFVLRIQHTNYFAEAPAVNVEKKSAWLLRVDPDIANSGGNWLDLVHLMSTADVDANLVRTAICDIITQTDEKSEVEFWPIATFQDDKTLEYLSAGNEQCVVMNEEGSSQRTTQHFLLTITKTEA
jgi:hypothetical protein